jgi:hypothetical protein
MLLRYDLLRVGWPGLRFMQEALRLVILRKTGWPTCARQNLVVLIRLEYVQALELLVQHSQRLKAFRLLHLRLEPILNFILSVVF